MNPDGVSNNSDTYNMHDFYDQLIINQWSEYFEKHFNINVSEENKAMASIHRITNLQTNPIKATNSHKILWHNPFFP